MLVRDRRGQSWVPHPHVRALKISQRKLLNSQPWAVRLPCGGAVCVCGGGLYRNMSSVFVLDELQLAWGLLPALFSIHEWTPGFLPEHS